MTGSTGAVVVGVDGSAGSRHALEWALAEARLLQRTLRVIHAWAPPSPLELEGVRWEDDLERNRTEAENLLASMIPVDDPDVVVESRAVQGEPAMVLLQELETDASLLVVGARGHGGFATLLLGSVADHCTRHASGPVVVVHARSPLPSDEPVLVGIDGSEGSRVALLWAIDEAAQRGAALTVAHAWWNPYWIPTPGFGGIPYPSDDFDNASEALLHKVIDAAFQQSSRRPASIELLTIADLPSRGLLEQSEKAGLLVVGSRGHSKLTSLLLGSVSQQCIHHATCAVAVIPTDRAPAPATTQHPEEDRAQPRHVS